MSPEAALESDVFRFYALLAAGLLLVGGLVLALLRWAFRKDVGHAWQAYLGWLILAPATFASLFLGRIAAVAFFTLVGLLGFREFARATELSRDRLMTAVVAMGIVAVGVLAGVGTDHVGFDHASGAPFGPLPVLAIAFILVVPVLRNRSEGQLRTMSLAVLAFVYFGWMFGHVAALANLPHAYSYLLYVLVAVELNDVAAYVFGKLLGRRTLRDNISPRKTWEGALGALAFSMSLPWLLYFTWPRFDAVQCLLLGAVVGVGGQLGDLVVSVIKRDLGIKDMGALLPGHGGILDRMDSLVYVAPLFFQVASYYQNSGRA